MSVFIDMWSICVLKSPCGLFTQSKLAVSEIKIRNYIVIECHSDQQSHIK